jgi:integrase
MASVIFGHFSDSFSARVRLTDLRTDAVPKPFRDEKSGRFYLSFSYRGRRYKRSAGTKSKSAAERSQRIIDGRVEELNSGLVSLPQGVTVPAFVFDGRTTSAPGAENPISLSDFAKRYEEETAPPNKLQSTHKTEKTHLAHLKKFARSKRIRYLQEADSEFFEGYKRWRLRDGVKKATVNREMNTLRSALNWAVRMGLLQANPFSNVRWLKEDTSHMRFRTGDELKQMAESGRHSKEEIAEARRWRYLTEEEIGRLLDLARGSGLHVFLTVVAYTGARFSEVHGLKWADVDLDHGQVTIRGRKGSRTEVESPRQIPIHRKLKGVLQQHAENARGSWVFADEHRKLIAKHVFYKRLGQLVKGTEFEGIGFHCLRHSFISCLVARGTDQRMIDGIVGHSTEAMRRRYRHLYPDDKEAAVEQLDF